MSTSSASLPEDEKGRRAEDLPDVHGLEQRVAVRGVGLSNVDKQVFAVLQWTETEGTREDGGYGPGAPPDSSPDLRMMGPLRNVGKPCCTSSLTLSGSLWTSMKAEYSSIRSLEEAMVRSCHTGTAVADGGGGGAKGS
ncbi:hypothetical protein EYF80_013284 [Liparis tanakae]|uniref:Uncharacterized protein n=1 Tax=Liparis tanakae TaxID=230148 RepID=A0A4Z2IE90_9TELE|nr:hypothetical protein EYF80_013284 [Liparis tanakae]